MWSCWSKGGGISCGLFVYTKETKSDQLSRIRTYQAHSLSLDSDFFSGAVLCEDQELRSKIVPLLKISRKKITQNESIDFLNQYLGIILEAYSNRPDLFNRFLEFCILTTNSYVVPKFMISVPMGGKRRA